MVKLLGIVLTLAVVAVAAAQAESVPLTMQPYGMTGQTTLFRGEVAGALDGTIQTVVLQDLNTGGGSSGVFSGFDLDFLTFDRDGNLFTTDDWISPVSSHLTTVTPGVVRKGLNSIYKPTADHPGDLFGLLGDGSVDHDTATLGTPDAFYVPGVAGLSVDTSHGWVSLGDGGQISVQFPLISVNQEQSLFIFIGEVGPQDESPAASTEIQLSVGAKLIPVAGGDPDKLHYLDPGERANLNGIPPDSPTGGSDITSWAWDLDMDGEFDDGTGPVLGISYEYMVQTLGLPLGEHRIALLTSSPSGPETYSAIVVVPEPVVLLLLGAGVPILLRARRRR